MSEFKRLNEKMLAAGQITADDVARAGDEGVCLIINNRPDDEVEGQPSGAQIEAAAGEQGIAYKAIPVSSAGFSLPQVDEMRAALDSTEGKVLAFCRSGTRSTILWALAEAKAGRDLDEVAREAEGAGYNTAPVRPTMEMLARG
ncbi:TIGR01244 family sulfur transferase [Qipengyuania sphaerica]|uniref:TIGR01244 family sulfur transferase n=1 Tax=Qipengyuania sphaerica TaxID=2867243 RepID=UPI001C874BD0|nr:TIGR01244 family sulfur transferase [Qipengyuania sphaerica]MBX7541383.1 TIGR01244 family phosphatase [Qipengyuania sphaerica]